MLGLFASVWSAEARVMCEALLKRSTHTIRSQIALRMAVASPSATYVSMKFPPCS
jgi:hypothetical protein